jgi:hypothetical protein
MKALEFESVLTPERTLLVPLSVAIQVPQGRPLRVMLFVAEDPDPLPPAEWKDAEQFQPEDLGTDTLYDEPSGR